MGIKQAFICPRNQVAALSARSCGFAIALVLLSALAAAQDASPPSQGVQEDRGFFATISRWFREQSANVNTSFDSARQRVEGFSRDAAKTTVQGAKDAAGAVVRIPAARAVRGHEKCQLAPNGAPDCIAAAYTMCKTKGFESGTSLDMTTAEVFPAKVYLSGRSTGPECTTETFVSRALCQ